MRGMAWTRWSLSVFAALFGTFLFAQPAPMLLGPPSEALYVFSRETRAYSDLMNTLERTYPDAATPLIKEIQSSPGLVPLLRAAASSGSAWTFSKWANCLATAVASLETQYRTTGNSPEVQALFFNVQEAYTHTLASAYLLIEGVKRQYLQAPWGPAYSSPAQRNYIAANMAQLHYASQRLMRWMYAMRCSTDFGFLFSTQYFPTNEAFESRYVGNYFVGYPADYVLSRSYDIATYLVPVAADEELRARLAGGNVRLMPLPGIPTAPAQSVNPPAQSGNPPPNNPPAQSNNPPPNNPPAQSTNPPLNNPPLTGIAAQIEAVKAMLKRPDVQANAELKQQLEQLLQSLESQPIEPPGQNWAEVL